MGDERFISNKWRYQVIISVVHSNSIEPWPHPAVTPGWLVIYRRLSASQCTSAPTSLTFAPPSHYLNTTCQTFGRALDTWAAKTKNCCVGVPCRIFSLHVRITAPATFFVNLNEICDIFKDKKRQIQL